MDRKKKCKKAQEGRQEVRVGSEVVEGQKERGKPSEPRLAVRTNTSGAPVWVAFWRDSRKTVMNRTVGPARLVKLPARKNPFVEGGEGRKVASDDSARRRDRWRLDWQETRKAMPRALSVPEAVKRAAELVAERERELDDALNAQAQADAARAQAPTFGELADQWLALRQEDADDGHLKLSTLTDYRSMLRRENDPLRRRGRGRTAHLMRAFESKRVTAITPEDVQAFERKLRSAKLSQRTRVKYLTVLSMVMDQAIRDDWISTNPVAVNRQKQPKRRGRGNQAEIRVFEPEIVEAIAREAEGQVADLIRLAALTGLRQGELLGLRWGDVSFPRRAITVRRTYVAGVGENAPKSGKARTVPLSDAAGVVLDRVSRRDEWTGPRDLVFGRKSGNPRKGRSYEWTHLGASTVLREYVRARDVVLAKRLETSADALPEATFHDLRHTFGTQCASAGIELPTLQAWMGHADIQTTMIYVHWTPKHDDADRLSRAQSSGSAAEAEKVPAAA